METVFITIHDLSVDARIKYVSDSVEDILGYRPHEIKGKSCWEYFHPDEMPFAKAIHGRGVQLDKAAVLNYCQIKHKDGSWVGCECVFTVVYDVLVASTSIYRRGRRSQQRALDAPFIRRIFSSSPRDPRYHMLSFISSKFSQQPKPHPHEPRAALFINRFTRSSTIMFATAGVTEILGLSPEHLVGQSFYFCIAENCLRDAVQCVESAKSNDSIAYLRFWYRNPIHAAQNTRDISTADSSSDDEEGGVAIASTVISPAPVVGQLVNPKSSSTGDSVPSPSTNLSSSETTQSRNEKGMESVLSTPAMAIGDDNPKSHRSSENSACSKDKAANAIFDRPMFDHSPSSSTTANDDMQPTDTSIELEAVVSCSSDGLVIILRNAHPFVPQNLTTRNSSQYANGVFASPWATEPLLPNEDGNTSMSSTSTTPSEPAMPDFMSTIQEVAVFAWALTGINGAIADYGQGKPSGEALPPGGLPIWDPSSNADPENRYNGFSAGSHRPIPGMGELEKDDETTSSEDEILWKRVPQIPEFRRPKRRDHRDAFGTPEPDAIETEEKAQQTRRRRIHSE